MQIITLPGSFIYIANSGEWNIYVGNGQFEIEPANSKDLSNDFN
jgi:hypothetical protein